MAAPIDLSKLETLVKSLNDSLDTVGTRLAFATAAVVIGLLIEYQEDARKVFFSLVDGVRNRNLISFRALESHVKRAAFGGLFITVGVGAELWYEHQTSVIESALQLANGQIVGFLNGQAQDAELATQGLKTEADKAHAQADGFKAQIADDDARVKIAEGRVKTAESNVKSAAGTVRMADARIAEAQRGTAEANRVAREAQQMAEAERLERVRLEAIVAPRSISLVDQRTIAATLTRFAGNRVTVTTYSLDGDGAMLAQQVIGILGVARIVADNRIASMMPLGGFAFGVHVTGSRNDLVVALSEALLRIGHLEVAPPNSSTGGGAAIGTGPGNPVTADADILIGVKPVPVIR